MAKLNLWFCGGPQPELIRTRFEHPLLERIHESVRGNTAGAFSLDHTFKWTNAVRAVAILLLRASSSDALSNENVLSGERRSLAASLDYALSKEPQWLADMFGVDASGKCLARRIVNRTNPERKRPGPVVLGLNKKVIATENLFFYLDGRPLLTVQERDTLATLIEQNSAERPSVPSREGMEKAKGPAWNEEALHRNRDSLSSALEAVPRFSRMVELLPSRHNRSIDSNPAALRFALPDGRNDARDIESVPVIRADNHLGPRDLLSVVRERQRSRSASRKAIILAAGAGTRMSSFSELPKCLLRIDQETFLERQVRALRANQVSEIHIVVGYKSEVVRDYAVRLGLTVHENERYRTTGMLESLWCAREALSDTVIVLYSDVYVLDPFVRSLLSAEGAISLATDLNVPETTAQREPTTEHYYGVKLQKGRTKVLVQKSQIRAISKQLSSSATMEFGEYVGAFKLEESGPRIIRDSIAELLANGEIVAYPSPSYLFRRLLLDGHPLTARRVTSDLYAECDYPKDIESARARLGLKAA